ncbi:hypothetical protein AKJ42_00040 [candidate division MSBL1 archaeon SCGC-AAA261C02]|uniref:Peptidase M24 domain-containing protein n=2 Tax=candidate division MSBL1 TaxID=215777 RepID=A0A133V2D3_9EURY|nr:hypothetical protein AKJ42_00040 [candidate division MSBL1 archaeon SCGC-AAA261C02]
MRIPELREKLDERELDAYIGVKNSHYLSETSASTAAIITPQDSILLCSRLDLGQAEKESKISDIRTFSKSEVPIREDEEALFGEFGEVLGKILDEISAERIGYDQLDSKTLQKLRDEHDAEFEEAPDTLEDLRMIKTEEEIKYLKKAAELAKKGMDTARELIEPGRSEIEIATEVEYAMRKASSEGTAFNTIVAAGEDSWLPHIKPTDRKLGEGELITVDLGAQWRGYRSDMTRTFSISPTPKQEKILKISKKAQKAALNVIKADVKAKEVDEAARKVVRKADYEEYYLHGSGHGVGLDIHEPPSLTPDSEDVLKEGVVTTVEPGIYVQGVGGTRFEDMILVTRQGYEFLTR